MKYQFYYYLTFILGIVAWLFPSIPTMVYPKCHKLLNDIKYYLIAVSFAVILLLANSYLEYKSDLEDSKEKILSYFTFINPLVFLILYKLFDTFILKIYKRHIYFRTRGGTDIESRKATWLEFTLQIILGTSLLLCFLLGKIVLKYFF